MRDLQALLIKHEGLKTHPYLCPAGKLTIGVGRNLDDVGISQDEAMLLLGHDMGRCINEAHDAFPWLMQMDKVRADVIVCMVFNLGLTRLRTFKKFLAACEAKDYPLAAAEMLNSLWSDQVGERSVELAQMMMSGEYE